MTHHTRISDADLLKILERRKVEVGSLRGQVDPAFDPREPDGVRCRMATDPGEYYRHDWIGGVWLNPYWDSERNLDTFRPGEVLSFLERTEWLRELPRFSKHGPASSHFEVPYGYNMVSHRVANRRLRARRGSERNLALRSRAW